MTVRGFHRAFSHFNERREHRQQETFQEGKLSLTGRVIGGTKLRGFCDTSSITTNMNMNGTGKKKQREDLALLMEMDIGGNRYEDFITTPPSE